MPYKRSRGSLERFVGVHTFMAQQLFAIKAVADFSPLFRANAAADLASIAPFSNSKKIQQTVVEKTGRQIIERISLSSFRDAKFGLTLGTKKFPLSLAG